MDCRPYLLESVLFEILIFLPVVSLLRFKAVCKSWCSLIESSSFIRQQLNHNREKNNLIVQIREEDLFSWSGRKHELCVYLDLEGIDPDFHIVGSCNGIICLGYEDSYTCWRLSLWNPAINQVRKLPELSYFSRRETMVSHGFALVFDIEADDYKIVAISVDEHGNTLNESLLQVYSIRTDSWRTIYEGCDFPVIWIKNIDAACENETCIWTGYSSTEDTMVVLFFDLTKGAYGTISFPDDRKGIYCTPTFVKEKVTCMEWYYETSYCCYYEIWRMNKFGIKESWNKLYKIRDPIVPCRGWLSLRVVDQLYISKNEDFILVFKECEGTYYTRSEEIGYFECISVYKLH